MNANIIFQWAKKVAALCCTAVATFSLNAQNVGISPATAPTSPFPHPSAGLDVSFSDKGFLPPRVSLTGPTDAATIPSPATGLIVYNTSTSGGLTPGLYFNRGTPASPYWATFEKTLWFKASATSGITNYASTAWAVIPGTGITFTIPTGMTADVYIWAYAGAMETATNSGNYATVDIAIFRNGAFLPIGGFNRITLDGYNINEFKTTSFATMETLGAGIYTYDIRGRRNGGTQAVNIGGNCATETNCGEIVIMVKFR